MIDVVVSSELEIPTPKVKPRDRVGIHGWVHYYAAFSPSFVWKIINLFKLTRDSLILDPFVGSGTTCVVAKSLGVPSIGVEFNPLAYFITRAKVGWNFGSGELDEELILLKNVNDTDTEPSDDFMQWFSPDDPTVRKTLAMGRYILKEISNSDLRDFLLAALLLSLRNVASIKRGSNPVWMRVGETSLQSNHDIFDIFSKKTNKMFHDQQEIRTHDNCRTEVLFGDTRTLTLSEKVDAVITSPPYLNRLDYIMNYRLENDFLANLKALPALEPSRLLRKKIIGTVTVIDKSPPKDEWGKTCVEILNKIHKHASKASASYYYPTIMKYFKDMHECLARIREALKVNGVCTIVVQTSYFKDIEIPVSQIFSEMAQNLEFKEAFITRRENVRVHMGLLDPEQRKYAPGKTLHEDVLMLKR